VVVTGAAGQVGREVVARFTRLPHVEVFGLTHADCDVSDYHEVMQKLVPLAPDVIVHAAGWTDVDGCEDDPARAERENALAVRHVRLAAQKSGADLVHMSTDYVFDGRATVPYREWDATNPLSVYGRSKLAGEREALLWERAFVVRTSWVVGQGKNFVRSVRARAEAGEELRVVGDQTGRLTLAADLAGALATLWRSGRYGVWHVANAGVTTWLDVARGVVHRAGLDGAVTPITTAEVARPAARPAHPVLHDGYWVESGFAPLRPWRDALYELFDEVSSSHG